MLHNISLVAGLLVLHALQFVPEAFARTLSMAPAEQGLRG